MLGADPGMWIFLGFRGPMGPEGGKGSVGSEGPAELEGDEGTTRQEVNKWTARLEQEDDQGSVRLEQSPILNHN